MTIIPRKNIKAIRAALQKRHPDIDKQRLNRLAINLVRESCGVTSELFTEQEAYKNNKQERR